jgi:hypothetical protein
MSNDEKISNAMQRKKCGGGKLVVSAIAKSLVSIMWVVSETVKDVGHHVLDGNPSQTLTGTGRRRRSATQLAKDHTKAPRRCRQEQERGRGGQSRQKLSFDHAGV